MNVLFVGDVFGRPGRQALLRRLPALRQEYRIDFVVVNGENAASGAGITSTIAQTLLAGGVDVLTTGNHVWRQREVYAFLDESDRIVRPANYPSGSPGRGTTVQTAANGERVAVINLLGQLYLDCGISPFRLAADLVRRAREQAEYVIVDFHAEATSEKVAMGHHLDGLAAAVVGTHTHVQTADARVLPGGTAYITDVGMTGPRDSVIGVSTEVILRRFLTEMPQQFVVAGGPVRMDAVVIGMTAGRAADVQAISETLEEGHAEVL